MADKNKLKEAPVRDDIQVTLHPDAGLGKVELDLDDAPFLLDEPDAPAVPEESEAPAVPQEAETAAAAPKKKKLLLLAGGGLLSLLVLGAAAWWFFVPPPEPDAPKPEVIVVPSKPAVPARLEYVKEFAPFLVERPDGKGGSRFLICKFSALTRVPNLDKEMDQKMLSLRDALYYYLRSTDNDFLLAQENVQTIKKELTSVLNNYLTQGQIEDVLFERYLSE
ncbi:flagellar basal body-associated FliL family protein [Desulfovibrio sp. ZJ200]|uniref:flagellar basal body-associated FliL family protein n=1 Tax=Desulfovibrio sp. ZJ200 TaxID=2709792 RepID=UPI0013EC12AA|nr:flagellar basal body-associated FliL family protein [Desulfovibrio sp. ZJ200]